MSYRKVVQRALALGGLACMATAGAATPSGEMLGNTCAGCHGTNGVSNGPATPTIAGISESYFIDAMKAYKDAENPRPATIMSRIAKGYSDEEIEAMAKFFSGKKYVLHQQKSDAAKASRGAKLHDKYCEKCHEDGGRSSEDDAGLLAGQWTPYLRYTLEDFNSGAREMPKKMKSKMEDLMEKHGAEGQDQLLNYYGSQK